MSPKNYSYRLLDPEKLNWSDSRRTKGIQRSVRDKRLSHADFVRQIFEPGPYSISNIVTAAEHPEQQNRLLVRRIGSERHTIYQYSTSRRGLSCFDDKRYLSANNITTIPYGHFGLTASLLGETWVPDLNSKVKSDFLFPLHNDVYSSCSRLNETGRLKRRAAAILIRLENHRGKRAKIEAQMPKANSAIDDCLAKELESGRLTQFQANYLKRNYVWNYAEKLALITNTLFSHEIASEMMDLIRDAGEAEDSRKWRRRNNPHSALGQQKARDLAGGYFVCPHIPNTVEEARRIKENNMRRAASASAKAAQRATDMAGDEAVSFMNLLPPALKRRRRARLGLPCLLSPTSSEERGISFIIQSIVQPEFDFNAIVGNT